MINMKDEKICEKIGDHAYEKIFNIRDTNIQKGAAILMILGIHLFVRSDQTLYSYHWKICELPALNFIFYQLKIGVTIFVILSGYGLNESYNRKYAIYGKERNFNMAFVRSHVSGLLSNFWIAFILAAGTGLSLGWISVSAIWGGFWGLMVDFFGMQDLVYDFYPTKTLNPTWWYMSAILLFYLFFPMIKKFIQQHLTAFWVILACGGGYSFLHLMYIIDRPNTDFFLPYSLYDRNRFFRKTDILLYQKLSVSETLGCMTLHSFGSGSFVSVSML